MDSSTPPPPSPRPTPRPIPARAPQAPETPVPARLRKAPVSGRVHRPRNADAVGSLTKAFGVWGKNFVPVSLIVLVVNLPVFGLLYAIYEGVLDFTSPFKMIFTLLIAETLVKSVAAGAVTYGVIQTLRARPVGVGVSFAKGLGRVFPVVGTGLLTGIVIAIGLVLLVVPGIILNCGLAVAVPAAVVERVSGTSAMDRSWKLTKGSKGSIFFALFLFAIFNRVIQFVVELTIDQTSLAGLLGGSAIELVVAGGLTAVFGAVLYHDLRVGKEGASVEEIAHVFD